MRANALFKGLTRPAMFFGVPITPLFVSVAVIFLFSFYTQNFLFILAFFPIYMVMKAMTKKDDFIFKLYFLKLKFFTNPANKKVHGAKTYNAQKYTPPPKNSNPPKLSVLGLNSDPDFEKLVPYRTLLNDYTVANQNYDLMATYELDGIPFECENTDDLDGKNDMLNMLFKSFASDPVTFYFHNARVNIDDKFQNKFKNIFLDDVDERYFNSFKGRSLYKNKLYITIIFSPLNKISRKSFLSLSPKKKADELKQLLIKFDEYLLRIDANLKNFGATRLGVYQKDNVRYSSQLEFYNFLIGGKFMPVRVLDAPINQYLTGNLNNIQFNYNMGELNYNDGSERFFRVIEIKDYTSYTFAGMLNVLMYEQISYTITQSFCPLARIDARKALDKQRKQLIASEDDSGSQIDDLEIALDDLASGELSFGNYHFNLVIYGESVKEAKENTNKIITQMNDLGFIVTLSNIALPSAYFSSFPSNYAMRPRVSLLSSTNYSNLIGLHNFQSGKRDKNCWGEAVTILKTPNKQPYYLNFHQANGHGDDFGELYLANTLILGQSGGGKTVLMNFIVNQMMKYANKDTFPASIPEDKRKFTAVYLDKDKGALGNILCCGGRYISIKAGVPSGFNPFMVEANQENIRQLNDLIKMCVTRNGEILNTKEEKQLADAINFIMFQFKQDERKYPISLLLENLTEDVNDNNSIKSRLLSFKKGKQFGWLFDNEMDVLDFPDDIHVFGIDGTEFLDDKNVSGILSYFIIWRVMSLADGRRLCVDIDEAWKWLENPVVAEEVKNKFKTIRKQNGFLRLATQSVEDFLKLPIAKTIIEQSATKIFLPNPTANEKDYVDGLNLSVEEYEIIRGFNPQTRQFLVKRQDEKVICTLDLSSLGTANLKILSTGSSAIDTIEKIFEQGDKSLDEKIIELKSFYEKN